MILTVRNCAKRAYADTTKYFSPRKEIVGSGAIFIVSGAVTLVLRGSAEIAGLWDAAIAGIAGVIIAWALFFLFNLVFAPYRIQRDRADTAETIAEAQTKRADAAEASLVSTPEPPRPINLLDLALIADQNFDWKLTSDDPSSGWQTWDFTEGLKHAANAGLLSFEGKDFGPDWMPEPNPFVRRAKLFVPIKREDWLAHGLQIFIPMGNFHDTADNFHNQIGGMQARRRYFDVQISDRNAALNWLKSEGPKCRGQSERWHLEEEARKSARRADQPLADLSKE